MNLEQARFNMIEQQIRPWDVLDTEILRLLEVVKREAFVPPAYKTLAFFDTEIPLSADASMFTPKLEARLLQEAGTKKHETVLEIGTGSGYMAALLANRARHVTSVEIDPALLAFAEVNLKENGIPNVTLALGDGAQSWGDESYDVIMVSGSLPSAPDALLKQLKVGGRLLAIIGEAPVMQAQLITRSGELEFQVKTLFETCVKALRNAPTPSHFKF